MKRGLSITKRYLIAIPLVLLLVSLLIGGLKYKQFHSANLDFMSYRASSLPGGNTEDATTIYVTRLDKDFWKPVKSVVTATKSSKFFYGQQKYTTDQDHSSCLSSPKFCSILETP